MAGWSEQDEVGWPGPGTSDNLLSLDERRQGMSVSEFRSPNGDKADRADVTDSCGYDIVVRLGERKAVVAWIGGKAIPG